MITRSAKSLEEAAQFQTEDAEFARASGGLVLGHATGMGKTHISLMAASSWPNINRVLVLGGGSSADTWDKQPRLWAADTQCVFLDGQPGPKRAATWNNMVKGKEGVWYSTYEMFRRSMKAEKTWNIHWDLVICDEAHKLRSRSTKLYEQMRRVRFGKFIGMSATWASRGPQDLWAILHLIDPEAFSSYWRWVHTFCFVEDTGFGKEVFGVKDAELLRKRMHGKYYRSRSWTDIGHQLPPIRRQVEEVDMTKEQAMVYKELDEDMMASHDDSMVVAPTMLAKLTRLHQLAVLPQLLFPGMGPGAALEHLCEAVEDDPHTVVYTLFAQGIPIIESALRAKGHTRFQSLRGGLKKEEVSARVEEWKRVRGIMICSVMYAESFRIDTSHTAYMLGFSWDPNQNIQAEGRLRAIDSPIKSPVLVKYYIVRGTVVEAVRGVTNDKARTVSQIFADYAIFRRQRG